MMRPNPSRAFLRIRAALDERAVPAYAGAGDLAFAYAQESLVEGLAEVADLDLVVVWHNRPPSRDQRPPAGLADPSPQPTVFDQEGFILDRFCLDGQQIDARHVSTAEVGAWVGAVEAGEGRTGYPMPVVSIHGLVRGILLWDPTGRAAELRGRLQPVPPAFRARAYSAALEGRSSYQDELAAAVERGDGLLFHGLATEYLRTLFIAWFAANDTYWPHEKRLNPRLRLAGQDELATLEEQVWACEDLTASLTAINRLAERLLGGLDGAP